ncbi:MAG: PLDc_N domain-containing protein [Chitinophagaceae bacterium]|nr:PLDc_N domain-containing protein [Chitinophagaceae bacterium]
MESIISEIGLFFSVLLGILLLIGWVIALIDILNRKFSNSGSRLTWLIIVFFLPYLGTIIYFLFKRKDTSNN